MDGSQQPDNSDGPWKYNSGAPVVSTLAPELISPRSVATPPTGSEGEITWTASEFIAHHKSAGWYLALGGCAIIVATLILLLTHDIISSSMVIVAALAFAILGARKPRELGYRLDGSGLTVGPKYFAYQQFRSFSIVQEGAFSSIVFMPLKRFALLTTIYYDPSDEAKIVDLLSEQLPLEDRQRDLVDRFMWHIRF